MAQNIGQKYLIMSHQRGGDPANANVPGTYPARNNDSNDPLSGIQHPTTAEYDRAAGFETPSTFTLGNQTVKAAQPWSTLPADLRERFAFWHHPTYNSAHTDFDNTMRINGAIKGPDGTGTDQIDSLIAQETYASLNCVTRAPISLGGTAIEFAGTSVPIIRPRDIQSLFASSINDLELMVNMRDRFIDQTYQQIKDNGTPAQKNFLDDYAISREAAKNVGDNLANLLNGSSDPARIAVALIQLNVSPLITVGLGFGGDNHRDGDLINEVDSTSDNAIPFINTLWNELKRANLQDSVVFSSLNVFGRTLVRNNDEGRDHNSEHHAMMAFGPNIKGGVVGGLEPYQRRRNQGDFKATAINSQTGGSANPDIPHEETFVSVGKTLAKAVGVSDEQIEKRFDGGRIITGALT